MAWFEGKQKSEMGMKKYPPALKLPKGDSVVEVLGEPEEIVSPDMNDEKKNVEKVIFPVKFQEQTFSWWVTKSYLVDLEGKPKDTLFAQLARIAKENGGSLTGAVLKVSSFGEGIGRRYMVQLK